MSGTEGTQDVPAGISGSRHFLRERGEPDTQGHRCRYSSRMVHRERRVHATGRAEHDGRSPLASKRSRSQEIDFRSWGATVLCWYTPVHGQVHWKHRAPIGGRAD